jgi:hypothetical protein
MSKLYINAIPLTAENERVRSKVSSVFVSALTRHYLGNDLQSSYVSASHDKGGLACVSTIFLFLQEAEQWLKQHTQTLVSEIVTGCRI